LAGFLALPAGFAQEPARRATGPELKIIVVEGDGAINNIRERTAKDPVVRIENDDGQKLSGASVTFTLPEIGAGGSFTNGGTSLSTATDEEGRAAARGLRPNNVAGRFPIRVNASYRGLTASTVINQTNVAPTPLRTGGPGKKVAIAGIAAAGALVGILFAARGGGDNGGPASPGSAGTVVTPGSPVFGPPR
jgi:hypothetical protein